MKFVKFIEHNENEGESWIHWLQYTGNKVQLNELRIWLNTFDDNAEQYELDTSYPIDEVFVDFACKHIDVTDYLHTNTKVKGTFTLPLVHPEDHDEGWYWLDRNFYKGGITRHFK